MGGLIVDILLILTEMFMTMICGSWARRLGEPLSSVDSAHKHCESLERLQYIRRLKQTWRRVGYGNIIESLDIRDFYGYIHLDISRFFYCRIP